MKPRILFVDHAGVLGGGELSLLPVARHFRDTSAVVLFEDGPFRSRLNSDGVRVDVMAAGHLLQRISRGGNGALDLLAIPDVLRLARRLAERARSYDLLYANSQKSMIVSALSRLFHKKPVVWHIRDLMTVDHFSRLHRLESVTFSNLLVARVLANSHATRKGFIQQGGRQSSVYTVYNGIDASLFRPISMSELMRIRSEFHLNGERLVGVFGRLARWKGQHVLFEALRTLPGVHALVVGDALFEDDAEYAAALKSHADRSELKGRIHFTGFRDDVPRLMQAVDVVVHTSTAPEPFGRVIVEGMLAGRPVVATRSGGAPEIIEHRKTGWLVSLDDASELSAALAYLFDEQSTAKELAVAGERAARSRFSEASMLSEIDNHLQEVVEAA